MCPFYLLICIVYHLKKQFLIIIKEEISVRKSKALVTSVLAGTLLFTGVGASQHVYATDSVVNANNATNIAVEVMNKNGKDGPRLKNYYDVENKGNYYFSSVWK